MNDNEKQLMGEISIKEYFETKIAGLEKATTIVATNLEKATAIAAAGMEKRLEGMNEFRNQLKDQSLTFVTKTEYLSMIDRASEDIKSLKDQAAELYTRKEHQAYTDKIDADIRVLRESKAELEGKASQTSVNVALIVSIVGIVLAAIGAFRNFMPLSTEKMVIPAPIIQILPIQTPNNNSLTPIITPTTTTTTH